MQHAGDWLKYELIDEETQRKLTAAASVALVAHCGFAVFGATDCIQSSKSGQGHSTTAVQAAVAAARGFFGGAMEFARLIAVQTVRASNL